MLRATFTLICKFETTLRSQSSKVVALMLPCFNLILISFILFYNKWMFLHKILNRFFFFLPLRNTCCKLTTKSFVSVVSSDL